MPAQGQLSRGAGSIFLQIRANPQACMVLRREKRQVCEAHAPLRMLFGAAPPNASRKRHRQPPPNIALAVDDYDYVNTCRDLAMPPCETPFSRYCVLVRVLDNTKGERWPSDTAYDASGVHGGQHRRSALPS